MCKCKFDKNSLLHIFLCFILSAGFGALISLIPPHNVWGTSCSALVLTMCIGIIKEYQDSKGFCNHFCTTDLLADFIGALIGSAVAWLSAYYIVRDIAGNIIA